MINLIPLPKNYKEFQGGYSIDRDAVTVSFDPELLEIKDVICEILKIEIAEPKDNVDISFVYDEKSDRNAYSLSITDSGIKVYASAYEGAFYAMTTLRQLYKTDIVDNKILTASCLEIKDDKPLYEWRGLQLDESRNFFGKESVKKLLDFMSLYKLNRFHWHLTDDQGWRVEVKKYPLLIEIGSKRNGTQLHSWSGLDKDPTPHEGHYTQEDIKEVIAYAKKRCIEIIPEIDFPGHCAAAIAGYNYLACREIPWQVFDFCGNKLAEKQGIKNWNRPLCLGKDKAVDFAKEVISELADLFPFEYFHVGGDEAPTHEWKKCPACQERMRKENLKNETDLQGWFTNQLNACLKAKGKIMVGWNEVLASEIDKDIVAQYWTPKRDDNVNKHIKNGGKVILSNHKYFYFDMRYSYCTPKGTYNFTYKDSNVPEEYKGSVLGVEGENWTEWTRTEKALFFKIFNRGLALAETAWSDESVKDYGSFVKRMESQKKIMDALDIFYGSDDITMQKATLRKRYLSKKYGFSHDDNDSEFRLQEILGGLK